MDAWLCHLAEELSRFAQADLTTAHLSNGRFQLSEESISAIITRHIYGSARDHGFGDRVWVRDYGRNEEADNGADFELWFLGNGNQCFGWRIQAKRLYPPRSQTLPPRYEALHHKVKDIPQAAILRNSVAAIPNLKAQYWLYGFNPTHDICNLSAGCRCGTTTWREGIVVTNPQRVLENTTTASLSFHYWSRNPGWAVPLHDLLCPGRGPGSILDRLLGRTLEFGDDDQTEVGDLPDYIVDLLNFPDAPAQRPRRGPLRRRPVGEAVAVIDLR